MSLALVSRGLLLHGISALRGSESAFGLWHGRRVIQLPNSLQVRGITGVPAIIVGTGMCYLGPVFIYGGCEDSSHILVIMGAIMTFVGVKYIWRGIQPERRGIQPEPIVIENSHVTIRNSTIIVTEKEDPLVEK